MTFAEVALPLRIFQLYTYSVPEELLPHAQVGVRVIVSIENPKSKSKKLFMGLIFRLHHTPPAEVHRVKPLVEILDAKPILTPEQFKLWEWVEGYYLAAPNELLHTFLPAGVRLERRSHVLLLEPPPEPFPPLSEPQQRLVDYLKENKSATIETLETLSWGRSTTRLLKELQDLRIVEVQDRLAERVQPKRERYVRFVPELSDKEAILNTLDGLGRRTAQIRVLLTMLQLLQEKGLPFDEWLPLKRVNEKAQRPGATVFSALVEARILEIEEREVSRIPEGLFAQEVALQLSPLQQQVYDQMSEQMASHLVTLLHGVTGSGKTELYIRRIKEVLAQGRQALFLLPEIALTEYMIARVQAHFGREVVVYHSRIPEAVRAELYWRMLHEPERVKLVLGVRSALFLPFSQLGLVVVDEEHDPSYKQQNNAPRYQGRDLAIVLAQLHGAKVLLGSATPAIESYYHATEKDAAGGTKYGFVELAERYADATLPTFETVDMRKAYHRKEHVGQFSDILLHAIEETVGAKKQVILFQNRRGFAPHVECPECGWVALCPNCDHGLTYHKQGRILRCHCCGHTEMPSEECPACHSAKPHLRGMGTQRLEEELQKLYPSLRIGRLDIDVATRKDAVHDLLTQLADGELDVLVGTQMVTKGLDLSRVALVGIFNADSLISFPDFRAHERAFDLIVQVGGRAGRRTEQGRVLIQTFTPELELFDWIRRGDYHALYRQELASRERFHYPPYVRQIEITLSSKEREYVVAQAKELQEYLHAQLTCEIFGPMEPPMFYAKRLFHQCLLLKIKPRYLAENKQNLRMILQAFHLRSKVFVTVDVDP